MILRRLGYSAVVGGAALLLTVSYMVTSSVDGEAAALYESRLRKLSAQNYRRVSELLLVRAGLVRQFDSLATTEGRLRELHHALKNSVPTFLRGAERERFERALRASAENRREAEATVERLKRDLAVLRNSLGFLVSLAREPSDAAADKSPAGTEVARVLDGVLRDILTLEITHDEDAHRKAKEALARLDREDPNAWPKIDPALVRLHAGLVVERSVAVDSSARSLASRPTEKLTKELINLYLIGHRSATVRDGIIRGIALILFFATCLAIAAYVILRLRRAAAELRRTGILLEGAVVSLEKEKNKQTELAELKNRFVQTTSHEFRTPLSVILSSAEMLAAYKEWPLRKKEQHLGRIRASALDMTRLLEDVLLIGRAESGGLSYRPAPFQLADFCKEVAGLAGQAEGTPARVMARGSVANVTVLADENLLKHVIGNLLSNALKYSPPIEPVELGVELLAGELLFVVRDHGIGIPLEDQRHLFSTFHRGTNVGRVRGSGLGLSIVKRAVDLQGGSIDVVSQPGAGTTVSVRVPVENLSL